MLQEGVRTFAVAVSAEMSPVATLVLWTHQRRAIVLADSLTFPVNGLTRNNVSISLSLTCARPGG